MFANPTLAPHLVNQAHRTVNDPESFWGSPAFKELNESVGGALTDSPAGTVCIIMSAGIDGVQLLTFGKRTATVLGSKVEDLPPALVQTALAVLPSLIVEGRHEPKDMVDILTVFCNDYEACLRALLWCCCFVF